jgi:GT2 family glycosyltransferase
MNYTASTPSRIELFSNVSECQRPTVKGKFIYIGDEKFYIKGVTYGAFPPNKYGYQFPEPADVDKDFKLMRVAGINTILTYTIPPTSLFDQAQENGIYVIVNIPWMGYVAFLESKRNQKQIRQEVKEGISSCGKHPAVMMYCVSKELPPQIVRWHGKRKIEKFLRELYCVAKEEDPDGLVTYTSFPTTEYLELPFLDVSTFNVYLHNRNEFCKYISRLQHLAGELPLVLTELGMCSFRHGEEEQAEFLDWQLEESFDHGLAGAVVFGWTDPFYQDNCLIEEWGFGLVKSERQPKPSYNKVKKRFTKDSPFPSDRKWPKISVVVALHNAADSLDDCLSSLAELRYPNHEVIVVNDGSTDESETIMNRYPFRNITTPNQGIGSARNVGLEAATGEIVAYIDSDAMADPDWLLYLASTYMESDYVAVGGPNFVPEDDNWIAKCVYRSPGGPTQVMIDDQVSEHIPGCNMSFWKWSLEEIGGFDKRFRAAGDDVDICWRLLEKGYRIGFNPSAVVWHRRRKSISKYWKQQVGYGISESILEGKHPNKFNPWGHTFWGGGIYAPYPVFKLFNKPVIYQGLWGSAGFQSIYNRNDGNVISFLPRAMEFHFILAASLIVGITFPYFYLLFGLGVFYTGYYCINCSMRADLDVLIESNPDANLLTRLKWRSTIALLHFLEPLARDWGRLKGGLTPWRSVRVERKVKKPLYQSLFSFRLFKRVFKWSHEGGMELEKFSFLKDLTRKLNGFGYSVGWNPDTEEWDLRVRRGTLAEATLDMVVEHHGGPKRTARLEATIKPPKSLYWIEAIFAALAFIMLAFGFKLTFAVLVILVAALIIIHNIDANRLEEAIGFSANEVTSGLIKDNEDDTAKNLKVLI